MIQINSLTKSYGERVLFDDLSLRLNARDKVGFVGRNGSGKSTLFKIILGEESYDSGEVIIPKTIVSAHFEKLQIASDEITRIEQEYEDKIETL